MFLGYKTFILNKELTKFMNKAIKGSSYGKVSTIIKIFSILKIGIYTHIYLKPTFRCVNISHINVHQNLFFS
jgi:hypothetical protein